MRILDLFCGAGGAATGYSRAGFEVFGVDINPQPNYPFEFVQADALTYLRDFTDHIGFRFHAIHASPPCQAYSITKHTHGVQHPDLLGPTRELLIAANVPYIIENVVGAYMPGSVICCGSDLCSHVRDNDGVDLFLKRHRQFESNIELEGSACFCISNKVLGMKIGGVYGGGSRDRAWAENVRHGGYTPSKTIQEKLMGIDWMTQKELNQAIPPAYTEYIGLQLMAYLENGKTAENMQGREL